jgi:hypothetical protein
VNRELSEGQKRQLAWERKQRLSSWLIGLSITIPWGLIMLAQPFLLLRGHLFGYFVLLGLGTLVIALLVCVSKGIISDKNR